jgi:hypothetical protein
MLPIRNDEIHIETHYNFFSQEKRVVMAEKMMKRIAKH